MKFTEAIDHLKGILEPGQDKEYFNESQQRYKLTLSLIPDVGNKLRVLDLASGFGHLSILIKKSFAYEVYAVDHYSLWEERFRKAEIKFNICELTTESLPFEEDTFDIVVCCEVIEHLFILPHIVLFDIHRVLKPQGLLILTTPNLYSLYNRVCFPLGKRITARISGGRDSRGRPEVYQNYGKLHSFVQAQMRKRGESGGSHIHEYGLDELRSLVEEMGFRTLLARCCHPRSILAGINGILDINPLRIIYRILAKVYPRWGVQIVIVGQKE